MNDVQHASLLRKAAAGNFPTIEAFLLSQVGLHSQYISNYNDARAAYEKLPVGSTVTMAQLLPEDWPKFKGAKRNAIGRMFAAAVENGLIHATVQRLPYANSYTKTGEPN